MEAKDGGASAAPAAREFRVFAERSGNDLGALAAMQRSRRGGFDPQKLADVTLPVMVLIGEGDTLVGSADKLTAAIPGAKLVKVPGDHLSAVGRAGVEGGGVGVLGGGFAGGVVGLCATFGRGQSADCPYAVTSPPRCALVALRPAERRAWAERCADTGRPRRAAPTVVFGVAVGDVPGLR